MLIDRNVSLQWTRRGIQSTSAVLNAAVSLDLMSAFTSETDAPTAGRLLTPSDFCIFRQLFGLESIKLFSVELRIVETIYNAVLC